jgi:pyridoxamine 5'-phosphate oxidase
MITIQEKIKKTPLKKFVSLYKKALELKQPSLEAACLSTSNISGNPDSRYINIKCINNNGFIFYSNYRSPKSKHLEFNSNISLNFFWTVINTQIRIKATAEKLPEALSDNHFKKREYKKNILSISSHQSCRIKSYDDVKEKYEKELKRTSQSIIKRPNYWGGFLLKPYYFEFWQGNNSRINKRKAYEYKNEAWDSFFLEP